MNTRMSASASKTVNHRALIGNLKRFDDGIRRLFEMALLPDSCENFFENFTGEPLDRREIQPYSEWKVQACFRNLNRRQKKRSKRRIIYILPIGPFPATLWEAVEGMEISLFGLIANFVAIFFHGMSVKLMDKILVTDMNCKQRLHAVTGKLQLLVSDVLCYLKTHLPANGYCIVGVTWVDLYPGNEWNFVLGESCCVDGCAVMSFGHFEPQSYVNNQLNETQSDSKDVTCLSKGNGCGEDNQSGSLIFEKEGDNQMCYLQNFAGIKNVDKQMIWRLLRVISHEICHVFGMSHCAYFACAMNESKSVLQAEKQPLLLCPVCLRKLQKALNFGIVERYKALSSFLDSLIKCDLFQKDCSGEQLLSETSDCKFQCSCYWLKSVLMFIENKATT